MFLIQDYLPSVGDPVRVETKANALQAGACGLFCCPFGFVSKLTPWANKKDLHFRAGLCFVGVAGFEPAASCSQSRRDNRATLHPEYNS